MTVNSHEIAPCADADATVVDAFVEQREELGQLSVRGACGVGGGARNLLLEHAARVGLSQRRSKLSKDPRETYGKPLKQHKNTHKNTQNTRTTHENSET